MDGRRVTTWAVALLAAAIGLEWLISDADAFGRRRRCCCDEVWTCCGGQVVYDPCGAPHTTQYGAYDYGDSDYGAYDYGYEGYEYSGEPMTEPEPYYEESSPGMERPQYETGRRPSTPSAPEPAAIPRAEEHEMEGMRGIEGMEEEGIEESWMPAPEESETFESEERGATESTPETPAPPSLESPTPEPPSESESP